MPSSRPRRNKALTYRDAVTLLAGSDNKILTTLDALLGGALAGTVALLGPSAAALIGPKNELVKLGALALGRGVKGIRAAAPSERSSLLSAAHGVIVVSSFFEAAGSVLEKYLDLDKIGITGSEQTSIARQKQERRKSGGSTGSHPLLTGEVYVAEGFGDIDNAHDGLQMYYRELSENLLSFLEGLSVWEQLPNKHAARSELRGTVVTRAVALYITNFRQLAVDVPEFLVWSQFRASASMHTAIAELRGEMRKSFDQLLDQSSSAVSLQGMRGVLELIQSAVQPPDSPITKISETLSKRYQLAIENAGVDPGVTFEGKAVEVPALAKSYVDPDYKIATRVTPLEASQETWWRGHVRRSDIRAFFVSWLLSDLSTLTPLIVLGNPGSGKSTLTKVLAANLPAESYIPIRFELRQVTSDASIRAQIDESLVAAFGRDWLDEILSNDGGLIPVIFLDGLDELLQSAQQGHADYLEQVADLQKQLRADGLGAVFIVTSRIVVADRVRIPRDSPVVKIEEFSRSQIDRWISIWNSENREYFKRSGIKKLLSPGYGTWDRLARQPLLLLMLAIFDSDSNRLRKTSSNLRSDALYEELLQSFIRREMVKFSPSAMPAEIDQLVEDQLLRLAIIAAGMFNRGAQMILDEEVTADFAALESAAIFATSLFSTGHDVLGTIGSFFFVHEAQATSSGTYRHGYEFMHLTFLEYLVARLFVRASVELCLSENSARVSTLRAERTVDPVLSAILSTRPLSAAPQILVFVEDLLSIQENEVRATWVSLVEKLIDHAAGAGFDWCTLPTAKMLSGGERFAAYSCNLVLSAAACFSMLPINFSVDWSTWQARTKLWQAHFDPVSWRSVAAMLNVGLTDKDGMSRVSVALRGGARTFSPFLDPFENFERLFRDGRFGPSPSVPALDSDLVVTRVELQLNFFEDAVQSAIAKADDVTLFALRSLGMAGGSQAYCVIRVQVSDRPPILYSPFEVVQYVNMYAESDDGELSRVLEFFLSNVQFVIDAEFEYDGAQILVSSLVQISRCPRFVSCSREAKRRFLGVVSQLDTYSSTELQLAAIGLAGALEDEESSTTALELAMKIDLRALEHEDRATAIEVALFVDSVGRDAESTLPDMGSWPDFLDRALSTDIILAEPGLMLRAWKIAETCTTPSWRVSFALDRILEMDGVGDVRTADRSVLELLVRSVFPTDEPDLAEGVVRDHQLDSDLGRSTLQSLLAALVVTKSDAGLISTLRNCLRSDEA